MIPGHLLLTTLSLLGRFWFLSLWNNCAWSGVSFMWRQTCAFKITFKLQFFVIQCLVKFYCMNVTIADLFSYGSAKTPDSLQFYTSVGIVTIVDLLLGFFHLCVHFSWLNRKSTMLDKLMFIFLHKKLSSYFPSLFYILLPTSIMDLLKLHVPDTGDTGFRSF